MLKTGLFAGFAGSTYAFGIEPAWIKCTTRDIFLPRLQKPLACAHISDFHYDGRYSLACAQSAAALLLKTPVDLICLTGDYTSWKVPDETAFRQILKAISAHAPTVAIFGNHDGGAYLARYHGPSSTAALRDLLESAGVEVFENRRETIRIGSQPLDVTGLADLWSGNSGRADQLLIKSKNPALLLAHNPDSKDIFANFQWDLMLSGHTHGGQVVIPGVGAPFAPVQDTKRVYGLFDLANGKQVHITSGVGNLRGIRVNCRPEISILKLLPVD